MMKALPAKLLMMALVSSLVVGAEISQAQDLTSASSKPVLWDGTLPLPKLKVSVPLADGTLPLPTTGNDPQKVLC